MSKWLDGYAGQSVDELIALAPEYRVDSIVLAFEQALQQKNGSLSEAELTVLAIEALEREVNNGGYHQFFLNTPEHVPAAVASLRRIGCPKTAEITAQAVSLLGLREPFTADDVGAALHDDAEGKLAQVLSERCDGPYYESGEPIADRLFEYIRANRAAIRLS